MVMIIHLLSIQGSCFPENVGMLLLRKKCLAIISAVNHFEVYLLGTAFRVITDHHALTYLEMMKETNNRLKLWALTLQPYSFSIAYRAGSKNGNADGLSRQSWRNDNDLRKEGGVLGFSQQPS